MKMTKDQARRRRKIRIRKKIAGTADRPRLVVFRSNAHLYAQLVDDDNGVTIASSSTQTLEGEGMKANCKSATAVGKDIASKAKDKKIETVVFDRNGFIYHGKIKAIADGAREGGLKF